MMICFIIALLLVVGAATTSGVIVYRKMQPKLKQFQELDRKTQTQNILLQQNNISLQKEKENLEIENKNLLKQKDLINTQISDLNGSLAAIEKQAQEAADLFYHSKMEVAQTNFANDLEKEAKKHEEQINSFTVQYNETVAAYMAEYAALEANVAELKAKNDAAVAAAKREEEKRTKLDFYRIQLFEEDVEEIEMLRSIGNRLRNQEPLNKVIWKCYYEKPTTDMIGRVIGSGIHTGIYKITEIETGKCYVGQAANLSERWKQHIKRGVGAETPTRNKLYPAMNAAGPENFTFEVIEECDRTLLDEREDFWQDYFKAREYGFSIK